MSSVTGISLEKIPQYIAWLKPDPNKRVWPDRCTPYDKVPSGSDMYTMNTMHWQESLFRKMKQDVERKYLTSL